MLVVLGMQSGGRAAASQSQSTRSPGEPPYVEILDSSGAVDGAGGSPLGTPKWDVVRLELRLRNRLPVAVTSIDLELALVSSAAEGEANAVIPGWSFRETLRDPVAPGQASVVHLTTELPARRAAPRAEEIAYRVKILSYRMTPPGPELGMRLLASPHASDQRAALKSYELATLTTAEETAILGDALALELDHLPADPRASHALRLLFVVRSIGALGDARQVGRLLDLSDRLDRKAWGTAIADLSRRMNEDAEANDARLHVLPGWARDPTLAILRANDTLEEATRSAILRMGDVAVPELFDRSRRSSKEIESRGRASGILHALGRSTLRSQLALKSPEARLRVIDLLGRSGSSEPVPALIELLRDKDPKIRQRTSESLTRIGRPAVQPIIDALGTRDSATLVEILLKMEPSVDAAIREAARRYGLSVRHTETRQELVAELDTLLRGLREGRLDQEIDHALELGNQGRFHEAVRILNEVFSQDESLYMQHAKPISALYFDRARGLFARGDFDAAISVVRTGLGISDEAASHQLLADAQIALVRGYAELGELDDADAVLEDLDSIEDLDSTGERKNEVRSLRARVLAKRAERAIDRGEHGQARTMLNRALVLEPDDSDLRALDRRLTIVENLAVVIVLAFLLPAGALAAFLMLRRRVESRRLELMARALDHRSATRLERSSSRGGSNASHPDPRSPSQSSSPSQSPTSTDSPSAQE